MFGRWCCIDVAVCRLRIIDQRRSRDTNRRSRASNRAASAGVCVREGWTPPSLRLPSAAYAADYSVCLRYALLVHILLFTCVSVVVVIVHRNGRRRGMCPRPSSLPSPSSFNNKHHGEVSRRRRIVLPSAAPQTSSSSSAAAATVFFWLRPTGCCGPEEKASESMGKIIIIKKNYTKNEKCIKKKKINIIKLRYYAKRRHHTHLYTTYDIVVCRISNTTMFDVTRALRRVRICWFDGAQWVR